MKRILLTKRTLIAASLLLLLAGRSVAQNVPTPTLSVPTPTLSVPTISYQAMITGKDGKPLTGQHAVKITIYADAAGTQPMWSTASAANLLEGGILNASLGSADDPLPSSSEMDRPLWVGVSVDGTPEMRPLSTFSAAPIALNVADNAITANKLADGAVTTDKIAADYVGSISVNGEKVTPKGADLNIVTGKGISSTYVSTSNTLVLSGVSTAASPHVDALTPFSDITTGTNTSNTLTVGSGSSVVLGGGAIEASKFIGSGSTSDAVDLGTLEVNGTLAVSNGGTGATSLTGVVHGNGTSAMTGSNVDLTTEVSGVLPVGNGGTGSTSGSWNLFGNSITGTEFLGTTNSQSLVFEAGGHIGLRLIYDPAGAPSVVGGDATNTVTNANNFIGGGNNNSIWNLFSGIGSGTYNAILNYESFIGGGHRNRTTEHTTFIGGGEGNTINSPYATIGGGGQNTINVGTSKAYQTIAGGLSNTADGDDAAIAGGEYGIASGDESAVLGGSHNTASGAQSAVAGGSSNIASGSHSLVSGGLTNTASGDYSGVLGGQSNQAKTPNSIVAGGLNNKTNPSGGTSTGGAASIGGGWNNNTYYRFSNVPGGINLTTSAEAQTVLGAGNIDAGHGHLIYWTGYIPNDDRVFEIGSPVWGGSDWVTNNAFEVSYNGHSIVYHTNGSSMPSSKPVYQGATYVESPVYAWGEFDATGGEIASFGISQVISLVPYGAPAGTYMVTLSPADPHGGPTPDIKQASVTVTIVNDKIDDIKTLPPPPPEMAAAQYIDSAMPIPAEQILAAGGTLSNPDTAQRAVSAYAASAPLAATTSCGYATASSIGALGAAYPRSFIIRTYQVGAPGDCAQAPLSFYLKVCHR